MCCKSKHHVLILNICHYAANIVINYMYTVMTWA